jgi:hypothetical protein
VRSEESCQDVNSPTFWLDFCSALEETGAATTVPNEQYVNLKLNPERWTGYNGTAVRVCARRTHVLVASRARAQIWNLVYSTLRSSAAGVKQCYEERVLHGLISVSSRRACAQVTDGCVACNRHRVTRRACTPPSTSTSQTISFRPRATQRSGVPIASDSARSLSGLRSASRTWCVTPGPLLSADAVACLTHTHTPPPHTRASRLVGGSVSCAAIRLRGHAAGAPPCLDVPARLRVRHRTPARGRAYPAAGASPAGLGGAARVRASI